ncbi:hypothetical protein [Sinorhizobium fredii]|uniref:hypothetical protein n=1 Tax=Rhizobium fredii TaxID=380 RepID=UPI00192C09BC|nr:hypothetical protein [Sinorhizobium fredii]
MGVTLRDASRYIDDYTISSVNGENGETLISALRQTAAHFELELNSEKSAIYPTSFRQNTGWKQALRVHIPQAGANYTEFQHFFYEVGRVCDAHPELNVEKFAFQNARLAFVRADDWKKIQSNLIKAYRRNSSLISFLVEIFVLRHAERRDVDRNNIKDFVENRLPVLAKANRSGEIIWLIFLILRLNITVRAAALEPMFEMDNSMIALLVVLSVSRGQVDGPINPRIWNQFLNADGLRSPMWLYAYESVGRGINPGANAQFIEQDQYFSLLHRRSVRFLEIGRGFTSIAATLRSLRGGNDRMRRVRDDFLEDFLLDLDEMDDDDFVDEFHDNEY